jgi:hypothetical protein
LHPELETTIEDKELLMVCPECQSETVYAPFSAGLVCINENCGWNRSLSDEQIHRLLFGRQKIALDEPESDPEGQRLSA